MRSLALIATFLASAPAIAAPSATAPGDDPVPQPTDATVPPEATPAPAPAPARPALVTVDESKVPETCRPLAKATASPSPEVALPARISLASCLSTEATKGLKLVDAEESVLAVDTAAAPSVELLDGVIATGTPTWKIVALHARGELLSGFVVRMEATVPPPAPNANEDAYALHDLRVGMLQPLLERWRTQARDSFTEVDKLVHSDRQLAQAAKSNKILAQAIDDSQKRLAAIATK